jgi:hypothetical protein
MNLRTSSGEGGAMRANLDALEGCPRTGKARFSQWRQAKLATPHVQPFELSNAIVHQGMDA